MTLAEFEEQVFAVALVSSICDIPSVVRLTATAIKLRIETNVGDYIDAFYNKQTGTTAYALIDGGKRIFGADNTGGWHQHPFHDPTRHDPIASAMTFAEFIAKIEHQYGYS
ncbi:MAG: hypothetical protein KDE19_08220 [Caldilineaceae bacterium]|nr:hypothetical protein [Caldilineaceae bacterium]